MWHAEGGSSGLSSRVAAGWPPSSRDWNLQIEKDLHRTFPGHPVMDSSGRNALRRLLAAYARRNPSVGYCQVCCRASPFKRWSAKEGCDWHRDVLCDVKGERCAFERGRCAFKRGECA